MRAWCVAPTMTSSRIGNLSNPQRRDAHEAPLAVRERWDLTNVRVDHHRTNACELRRLEQVFRDVALCSLAVELQEDLVDSRFSRNQSLARTKRQTSVLGSSLNFSSNKLAPTLPGA